MADNMMRIAGREPVGGMAKAVCVNAFGNLSVEKSGEKSAFDYSVLPYSVLTVRGIILYARGLGSDNTKLYKSNDSGENWSQLWTIPSGTIIAAKSLDNGVVLVFGSDNILYRSANDATFSSVLTSFNRPFSSVSVDANVGTVCFGEYTLTAGQPVRIFASTDYGATWNVAITVAASSNANLLTHVHSCQYVKGVGMWIACVGDTVTSWYRSSDGIVWTELFYSRLQVRRAIGVLAKNRGELMWASDGNLGNEGVYSSSLDSLYGMDANDMRKLVTLPSTSYGLAGSRNVIVACTRATSAYVKERKAYLFVSIDNGETWKSDAEYAIPAGANDGGFSDILGPDTEGNFYAVLDNVSDIENYSTVKMTPAYQNTRERIYSPVPFPHARTKLTILKRQIISTSFATELTVPTWAKGAIFVCRVWAATGATPLATFHTDAYFDNASGSGPRLASTGVNTDSTLVHIWMQGTALGDATARVSSLKIASLFGAPRMYVAIDVSGTFSAGEGIDCDVDVIWQV